MERQTTIMEVLASADPSEALSIAMGMLSYEGGSIGFAAVHGERRATVHVRGAVGEARIQSAADTAVLIYQTIADAACQEMAERGE